jgi:hypothetical protein
MLRRATAGSVCMGPISRFVTVTSKPIMGPGIFATAPSRTRTIPKVQDIIFTFYSSTWILSGQTQQPNPSVSVSKLQKLHVIPRFLAPYTQEV